MNLSDLVPSLKRALATPGTFADLFPDTLDTDLTGTLADAVAECQLDGFLSTTSLNLANSTVDVDLTASQQALVVLYAMGRVLNAKIANLKNRTRFKAGNAEAETEQSATIILELMRDVRGHKRRLLEEAKAGDLATAFAMVDLYVAKSIDTNSSDLQYIQFPTEPRF